jgi:Fuc2NAc and GlcNAc transferase
MGLKDIPSNRSSHDKIIPSSGGIGIPLAAVIGGLIFIKTFYLLLLFAIVLSILALIDDRKNLPVWIRLTIQIFVSLLAIVTYRREILTIISEEQELLAEAAIIFLFLVIMATATNFFNFMDGINGIAGFETIVSFGLLAFYINLFKNQESTFMLCLVIISSTAGFLLFNFPKAKVFMGDVGSIFIGFLFVTLVLLISENVRELLVLISFQYVFYLDCITTIFIRLLKKQNIFKPHLMHLYQRLVHRAGWSHAKVALSFAAAQLLIGIGSILLVNKNIIYISVYLFFIFCIYVFIRLKRNLIE